MVVAAVQYGRCEDIGMQGNRIRLLADTVRRNPLNAPLFAALCEATLSTDRSLVGCFSVLGDLRSSRQRRHSLIDMIVIAIAVVLCRTDDRVAMAEFERTKQGWLVCSVHGTAPRHSEDVARLQGEILGQSPRVVPREQSVEFAGLCASARLGVPFHHARGYGETAVVVGDKLGQEGVGGFHGVESAQAQLFD
jgi:hypothetical protein